MFPSASPRGTLRSRGNKTHCFPWDQSLSAYCFRPLNMQICDNAVAKAPCYLAVSCYLLIVRTARKPTKIVQRTCGTCKAFVFVH